MVNSSPKLRDMTDSAPVRTASSPLLPGADADPLSLRVANAASFALMLAWNALPASVVAPWGGGASISVVADRFAAAVEPAGWAFAIWGPIFCLLAAFAARLAVVRPRGAATAAATGPRFVASNLLVIAWLSLWQSDTVATVVLAAVPLVAVVAVVLELSVKLRTWEQTDDDAPLLLRATVDVPLSLYGGWLTVAALLNISDAAVALGASSEGPAWVSIVVVGAVAGLSVLAARADPVWPLSGAWAAAAIAVDSGGRGGGAPAVRVTAALASALLGGAALWTALCRARVVPAPPYEVK